MNLDQRAANLLAGSNIKWAFALATDTAVFPVRYHFLLAKEPGERDFAIFLFASMGVGPPTLGAALSYLLATAIDEHKETFKQWAEKNGYNISDTVEAQNYLQEYARGTIINIHLDRVLNQNLRSELFDMLANYPKENESETF